MFNEFVNYNNTGNTNGSKKYAASRDWKPFFLYFKNKHSKA